MSVDESLKNLERLRAGLQADWGRVRMSWTGAQAQAFGREQLTPVDDALAEVIASFRTVVRVVGEAKREL